MKINRQDTNGVKPLLAVGELGYDNYPTGGDAGRVYVGNGSINIPQAKKAEVVAVDGKVDTHVVRVDNPHAVTKAQVGLGNVQDVDTTNASNITSGTLANARLANSGVTAGTYKSVTVDGKGIVTGGTNPTTLGGYGITDTYTKTETNTQISTAVNGLVDAAPGTLDTLNELAAALGDDPNFATTTANNIAAKVAKVASTDNAVVRFDGVTGQVQNSGVIIDDSGNVGIGVTPSAWGSGIKGLDQGARSSLFEYNGDTILNNNGYHTGANWIRKTANACSMYKMLNGAHYWATAPSGTAGNAITWTDAMALDASGNLSLGYGSLLINNLSTSSGNNIVMYGANKTNYIQLIGRDTINTDGVLASYMGGVLKSAILANGSFQSATNSYGSTSDAKLKENVVDTSDKLDKLMNVRVVNFNYIGDDQKQIGVIAQEIEQIFPGIVYETKDTKQVEVEKEREKTLEDGTVEIEKYTETETVESGETTKNVKYSVIYMMMLKGMQEQQEIINDLKARIEILEGAK